MTDFAGNHSFTKYKKERYFKPFDLIIYFLIFLIVATSIIILTLINKNNDVKGFAVYKGGMRVLTCDYSFGISINEDYDDNVKFNNDGTLTITFDDNYNTIKFSTEERWVRVIDANCKTHDCVTSGKLTSSGVILCLHNDVKILPIGTDDGITVGGVL